MKSESPLFQIVSLLLMFGPIYLFWYIDWYWIVGYYNLFFTYSALTLYKSYNRDSNYRRKYHPIIYLGLPLILNFVGFLISLLNGFEEIRKDEKVKEKSLNKNISQENQKANQNVGDEYEFLPIDSFDNEDIELLKTLYQLYKDLDFEKYQTNAYDLWKKYLDKRINEFYSLKEGEEIIIKKLSKGVGDDEEEYFLELVYEGSQVTNGYDSDNEKFEHGFYCNILKLEYRFGGDSDIICFFPPFATFNKSDENFFLVNYPKKYNSFEFVNAVSNIESEQGKIEDICRSLSKFHFVEFNRFSKQEDGRIHTNRIIELEEAEKDDNSDFKADKKESKEQELKESEVSFDTDQEWEIEKDYLKNPSFKFRKIENGNIVSINWIYGFDKVYDYFKAGENIYKHRVPFYWYEEEGSMHVIVFRIIDVRLGKKFIDTLISLNGGEYSFKKIENVGGWEYLQRGDLFSIGILPDHMCVRINKIDSFTSVSDDLKYGINENDKKLRELIKGASKIFYNEGEGPSNGRICVRTTDENYWAYAFYDNISDSIDYFRKIVSNYEKNHDVFKYKDEELDKMIKGVGIEFKNEQFELLLINENIKYKFYIFPPGGLFTGKWS